MKILTKFWKRRPFFPKIYHLLNLNMAFPQNPIDDVTPFGLTNFRNLRRKFGIKVDDRRRHMYLIGKTGMGKSTTIENMIIDDIRKGKGVALIDPLGDLVEKVIEFIPSYRVNDVVYFNPSDLNYPIAFNVLESVDPTHHHLVTSGLIAVFKKIWVDSWGPRLEYVLRNTILALLEYPGSTLLGVTRLLVDKNFRAKVISRLTDPIVKAFWVDEYSAYSNQFRTEAISPIQNKVGQFLSSSVIRNIVGQSKSTIDMREIMDNGKILLLNLAKGRIGEDNSSLLGAMMVTKIQLAGMSRVDIPEEQRNDFYLYVDEFQNFATESFGTILSEARKYRLNLTLAHQYIEQLDEKVAAAVFGNVGTIVCFRVGAADAEFLVKEFDPVFSETDLVNLTKFEVYLKLMIDGVSSEPFSALTLPPLTDVEGNKEKIINVSRERYSIPREEIEEKILRWSGMSEMYKETAQQENIVAERRLSNTREYRPEEKETRPKIDFRKEKILPVESIKPSEEISLNEALKREPIPFGRRRSQEKRIERTNDQSRPEKKSFPTPNYTVPALKPHQQTLKPGQVIRLDR
ncbi:MAG: type IV secretion system DNA-binding domain-containing protein [Patescibacteria group bacterium]